MNAKKNLSRFVSIFIAVTVFASIQLPFVQTADAAGNKKTVYVVTRTDTTYKDPWGSSKYSDTYKYNKKGLLKTWKNDDGKTKYKRNKAGLVTSLIWYDENGKKGYCYKNTIKNGNITKCRDYEYIKGKKVLADTTYYTYNASGRLIGEKIETDYGRVCTNTYDSKGNLKKKVINEPSGISTVHTHTITLDKHGNFTKDSVKTEETDIAGSRVYTDVQKNKYTYNKAGKITKIVTTFKHDDGSKSKATTKFTYNKAGKIIKREYKADEEKSVTVYKYKKIKVAKKYRKLISAEQKEIVPVTEQNL